MENKSTITHTHQTRHHQRLLISDYPWQGVFETKEQVDAYVAGDKIQCLLCGKWYKQLSTTHLTRKHGVTPDEYRERYRLPYHCGLLGQATRAKHSRQARKLQAEGKLWRSPKGHRIIYDQPARPRPSILWNQTWRREDYEAILSRMQTQQRSLHDVCRDPDLPGINAWRRYVAQHPEFAERVKQIYAGWPYAVQIRFHCKLSPQFTVDCRRLQAQGMSCQQIADRLGVGRWTVARHLRPLTLQRTWQREDYEAVLSRIQTQQRSLKDVLGDPDLPGQSCWRTFVAHHPELVDCVTQIYASWPYKVQAQVCRKLSPQFTVDCRRLQAQGMSYQQIADTLGVGRRAVTRHLKSFPSYRTWQRADYEAVLSRMQAQQRSLSDVCRDPDLPGIEAWRTFVAGHPEFAERVKQIYAEWPYAVQARVCGELSPQFMHDCQRLRAQGMTYQKIADTLGVSYSAVVWRLAGSPRKAIVRSPKTQAGPLPGYPWQGAFETKEEVEAYFADERIQCLLCGRWYKQISSAHLPLIHEMTPDEYRERYRLPYHRGLIGQETYAKCSQHARNLISKGILIPPGNGMNKHKQPARPRQPFLHHRKWQRKDYEAVLSRMQAQQRSLKDVLGDPDLPGKSCWKKFVAQHPEFVECVKQIYASWPYAVQARLHCGLPPQFTRDCQRLQAQGMSYQQIADKLGVERRTVTRRLRPLTPQRTWQQTDYEAILSRMQAQQRSLHDVLDDPDLPGESNWRTFVVRHPEFAERVKQIYASWPYAVQGKLLRELSPQFTVDCRRLRAQGLSYQKIAEALEVGISSVVRHLKKPVQT